VGRHVISPVVAEIAALQDAASAEKAAFSEGVGVTHTILAQQKQKDKKDANLLKEQEAAQLEIKSPRAEAKKAMEDARRKHRRKGLPMKSLPAPREIDLAARTLEGEGDPKAALSDERPPSSAATAKDTSGVARVRRRKPAKPCASLLPMW
jgi:hypothetical protein